MNDAPLVTCVMIFLDACRYIAEAIESVRSQSFGDWELVLIDDGSSDASTEIARGYASRLPDKVRYFDHPEHANRGMSASRNLGISRARGKYIALLDADDVWMPGKLAAQVEALESRPEAAMVYDASLHWFTWNGDPAEAGKERLRKLGFPPGTLVRPPDLIPRFLRRDAETPGTCSVLLRREIVDSVGGFVESFRGLFEDQAFFYKICLEHPVLLADGHTALYRQHSDSHCHAAEGSGNYDRELPSAAMDVFLDWLADHVARRLESPESPARLLEDWVTTFLRRRRSKIRRLARLARRAAGRVAMRLLSSTRR